MSRRYAGIAIAIAMAATGLMAVQPIARRLSAQTPQGRAFDRTSVRLTRRVVPGEVIVRRQPGAGPLSTVQMAPLGFDAQIRTLSGGELVYRIAPNVMAPLTAEQGVQRTLAAVQQLRATPGVVYVQPNYIYEPLQTSPNDPRFADQWSYFTNGSGPGLSPGGIGLPLVWTQNKGSANVVVAVIDTGILKTHADIVDSPNLLDGYDFISDLRIANDGDGRDADATDPGDGVIAGECGQGWPSEPLPSSWHGTHVSGVIGVVNTNNQIGIAGINWRVKVLPVRVLGKCGGTTADIIDAIRWSAGLPVPGVPPNVNKARVINMSLGGPQPCKPDDTGNAGDPAMQSAIDDAVRANAAVVVAAGNDASDAATFSPASCDNVIAVAASDAQGHLASRYSNFGSTVKILAPGGDVQQAPDGHLGILSTVNGGYAFYNGTSMAAPHVSGVAALLLACNPNLTPASILQRLQASALPRDASHGCPGNHCGAGLLSASAALAPACANGSE